MNRCHISRFVSFFRGHVVVERKVSLFHEMSESQKAFLERQSEGSPAFYLGDSEVRETPQVISSY